MDSYKENNKPNVLSSNIPKLMIPPRTRANYYSSPENIIKYLRSSSLAGSGSSSSGKSSFRSSASPQSEKTPVKVVEEDVLVMDGVLVASDTNIVGSGSSSSSAGAGFYKTEACRAWEEFGHCRYGSRCQFAHGKEEERPTYFPFKSKSEAQMKSYASTVTSTYGLKSRLLHPVMEAAAIMAPKDSPARPHYTSQSSSTPIKPEETVISSIFSPASLHYTSQRSSTPTKSEETGISSIFSRASLHYTSQRSGTPTKSEETVISSVFPLASPYYTSQSSSTPTKPEETIINSISTIQPEKTRLTANFTVKPKTYKTSAAMMRPDIGATTFTNKTYWSPQDDGINVTLPSLPGKTPSREEVDGYIDSVLYGPGARRSLPVFSAICPE